jgi:hypothetical protein
MESTPAPYDMLTSSPLKYQIDQAFSVFLFSATPDASSQSAGNALASPVSPVLGAPTSFSKMSFADPVHEFFQMALATRSSR